MAKKRAYLLSLSRKTTLSLWFQRGHREGEDREKMWEICQLSDLFSTNTCKQIPPSMQNPLIEATKRCYSLWSVRWIDQAEEMNGDVRVSTMSLGVKYVTRERERDRGCSNYSKHAIWHHWKHISRLPQVHWSIGVPNMQFDPCCVWKVLKRTTTLTMLDA